MFKMKKQIVSAYSSSGPISVKRSNTLPSLVLAVHGLVDYQVFEGLAVLGDADKAVDAALEMPVVLVHGHVFVLFSSNIQKLLK